MALRLVLLMVLTLVDLTHSSNSSRSAVCRKTPTLDNGNVIKNEVNKVTYKCNIGYKLSVTGICRRRSWRPQVTCKVVQCPAGEPISNSIDTTITGTLGANFTFDCKPGFSKFGPTGNMTCGTDGQWNIDTACEEVQCPAGDPITNSTDTTIVGTLGENFTFDCRPGFSKFGPTGNMTCGTDGQWEITFFCIVPQN